MEDLSPDSAIQTMNKSKIDTSTDHVTQAKTSLTKKIPSESKMKANIAVLDEFLKMDEINPDDKEKDDGKSDVKISNSLQDDDDNDTDDLLVVIISFYNNILSLIRFRF